MEVVPPKPTHETHDSAPASPGTRPRVIRPRSANPPSPMGLPRPTEFFPSFAAGSALAPLPLPSTSGPASTAGSRTSAFSKYVPPAVVPSLYPSFVEQQQAAAPAARRSACHGASSSLRQAAAAGRGQGGAGAGGDETRGEQGQRGPLGGSLEERAALLKRLSAERAVPTGEEREAPGERTADHPPSPPQIRVRKRRRHSVVPQLEGMSPVRPEEELPTPFPPFEPPPALPAKTRSFQPANPPQPSSPPASNQLPPKHPHPPNHEPSEPVLGIPVSAALSFCGPRARVLGFPCLPGGATGGHSLPVATPGGPGNSWLAGAAAGGVGHGMAAAGWGGGAWPAQRMAAMGGAAREGWGWGATECSGGDMRVLQQAQSAASGGAGATQSRRGMHAALAEEHRAMQAAWCSGGAARVPMAGGVSALAPQWEAAMGGMMYSGASHLAQPHGPMPTRLAGVASAAPSGSGPMEWVSARPDCVPAAAAAAAPRLSTRPTPTPTPAPAPAPTPTLHARRQAGSQPATVRRPTLADLQALQSMMHPEFAAACPPQATAASLQQFQWAALAASGHWGRDWKPQGVKAPAERCQRDSLGRAGGPWWAAGGDQTCADRIMKGGQFAGQSDAGLREKTAIGGDGDGGWARGPDVRGAAMEERRQKRCAPLAPVQMWHGMLPQSPVAVHELCHWRTKHAAAQLPAAMQPYGAYIESKTSSKKFRVTRSPRGEPSPSMVGAPPNQQCYFGRPGTGDAPSWNWSNARTAREDYLSRSVAVLTGANRAEQVAWSKHAERGGTGRDSSSPGLRHACSHEERGYMMENSSSSLSASDSRSGRPSAHACELSHNSEASSRHVERSGGGLPTLRRGPRSASVSDRSNTDDKADSEGAEDSLNSGAAAEEDVENMGCAWGGACPEGEADIVTSSVTDVHPS